MAYGYILGFLMIAFSGFAQAAEDYELRVMQAQAQLPAMTLWLNMPQAGVLTPEQFSVSVGTQAAQAKQIEGSKQSGEGVAYIFLVDISKSLNARQFEQIRRALHGWLDGLGDQDQVALISFGHDVKRQVAFTADYTKVRSAIDNLAPTDMETSLFQGLLDAINLGRLQAPDLPARRAIVVLSDGIDDTVSGVTVDEVFRQSREYPVPIYSIGFLAPPSNDNKREGLKVLGMLSRQSGGYFVQAEASRLEAAYEQQRQSIIDAYRLRIECPDCVGDGQLQHVNVTWSDGRQTLNGDLDMRLLPQKVAKPASLPAGDVSEQGWALLIFAVGILGFLLALLLVYRQRLASTQVAELEAYPQPQSAVASSVPRAAPSYPIQFTVVSGMQKGRHFRLEMCERMTLGRAAQCDLTLDDDVEISSQHALLQRLGGKLILRDLNSTNGTLVNGVPIHNDYPLRNGDLLLLGRTELRISFVGPAG